MTFAVVTRCFIALLAVSVATYGVLYLVKHRTLFSQQWAGYGAAGTSTVNHLDGDVTSTHVKTYGFPPPNPQHLVITKNSDLYLKLIGRESNGKKIAHGKVIVLRHRANTSTNLVPTSKAGRLAAVCVGRTGNWMNIYSGLYGIARRNGMRHVISANNPLLKLFRLNVTLVSSDRPGRGWVQYVAQGVYDRHTEHLDPRINVELVGYFNNWKYHEHVMRDLVQNHFRFRDNILQEADNFLRRSMAKVHLTPSDVAVIAVHIRRTDMLRIRTKAGRGASVAGREYFDHAVTFFNRLFNNKTMYVVCSDDMEWSKVNVKTGRPTVFSVGHSAHVDLTILSRCNHSIIIMGTFGQWSARMAGGVNVYQKAGAPTDGPLEVADRKLHLNQDSFFAWIALS